MIILNNSRQTDSFATTPEIKGTIDMSRDLAFICARLSILILDNVIYVAFGIQGSFIQDLELLDFLLLTWLQRKLEMYELHFHRTMSVDNANIQLNKTTSL